jgi:hypothetical protein
MAIAVGDFVHFAPTDPPSERNFNAPMQVEAIDGANAICTRQGAPAGTWLLGSLVKVDEGGKPVVDPPEPPPEPAPERKQGMFRR